MAARPRLRVAGVGEVELAGASVAGVARECARGAVRRQQWSELRAGGVDRGIQPHPWFPAASAAFDPEQAALGGQYPPAAIARRLDIVLRARAVAGGAAPLHL